jgi:hypothetical protein
LKAECSNVAIRCNSCYGPFFSDLVVSDQCNANADSDAYFDGSEDCYTNNTGLDGNTLFAGSQQFQVKEIEVFEIKA